MIHRSLEIQSPSSSRRLGRRASASAIGALIAPTKSHGRHTLPPSQFAQLGKPPRGGQQINMAVSAASPFHGKLTARRAPATNCLTSQSYPRAPTKQRGALGALGSVGALAIPRHFPMSASAGRARQQIQPIIRVAQAPGSRTDRCSIPRTTARQTIHNLAFRHFCRLRQIATPTPRARSEFCRQKRITRQNPSRRRPAAVVEMRLCHAG